MIRVEDAVEVRRDPATVFAFLAGIERYPEWLPGVTLARQTSPGPMQVGTTFMLRLAGPTGPIDAAGKITDLDPDRRLVVAAESNVGDVRGGFRLQPAGESTRVSFRMELALRGMARFAEGMVERRLREGLPAGLTHVVGAIERWQPDT